MAVQVDAVDGEPFEEFIERQSTAPPAANAGRFAIEEIHNERK